MVSIICFLIIAITVPVNAQTLDSGEIVSEKINENIPESATRYVQNNLYEIVSVALYYYDEIGMEKIKKENAILGEPYVIYELDNSVQDEIYYYPILDKQDGDIILNVTVMGTEEGWNYCIDTNMVDELNKITYDNNYIFYKHEDTLIAEDGNSEYILSGKTDTECKIFSGQDFEEKVDVISEDMEKYKKVNTDVRTKTFIEEYSPGFQENTKNSKLLKLYNAKGQGQKNTCWACSVATIVNYIKGRNITGSEVCKTMKRSESGASITVKQAALRKYGISYDKLKYNQLSWNNLCKNIDSKKPVALSSFTSDGKSGHSVTAHGYKKMNNKKYVLFWNSWGAGSNQIMQYKENGCTYSSPQSNKVFVWKYSLSNK